MNTRKLKASWLKMMAAAFAASVMATGARGAEKITVDEVSNHYPWDGKVDCVTTLSGLETSGYDYKGAFTLSVRKDGAKLSQIVTNDLESADGTYTNTFDCTALFGAGLYPNGGIAVDLLREKQLGGVQLWKDGPYWAECNIGASKPEEYGYYFWWGDTVGYTNTGSGWISVKDGTQIGFSNSSPANSSTGSDDWIDTTGKLKAEYDAATLHLGEPWRMPTSLEIQSLIDNCSWTWTENWKGTGSNGMVVTGKSDGYTGNSIFIPCAAAASNSEIDLQDLQGYFWSSTPPSMDVPVPELAYGFAFCLNFVSTYIGVQAVDRFAGMPVRPIRGFAQ